MQRLRLQEPLRRSLEFEGHSSSVGLVRCTLHIIYGCSLADAFPQHWYKSLSCAFKSHAEDLNLSGHVDLVLQRRWQ